MMNKKRLHSVLIPITATAVLFSGVAAQDSWAVNGTTSDGTDVVWGVVQENSDDYGSYHITSGGKRYEAYRIAATSQSPLVTDAYNQDSVWKNLDEEKKSQLQLVSWISQHVTEKRDMETLYKDIEKVADTAQWKDLKVAKPTITTDRDALTAALAAVVLGVNDTVDNIPEKAKSTYDTIINLAKIMQPDDDVAFMLRSTSVNDKPDVFVPALSAVEAPVVGGVTFKLGDTEETSTPTTTTTEDDEPIFINPTTTKTEEPQEEEVDIQLRTSAGSNYENQSLLDVDFQNGKTVVIRDTVIYNGVKPNEEYRLVGEVIVKKADGTRDESIKAQTGEVTWTPEAPNGRIDVAIPVENIGDTGNLVVFETLYNKDGEVVAEHKDINDKAQSFNVRITTSGNQSPTQPTTTGAATPTDPQSTVQPYQSCGEYYQTEMGAGLTPEHPRWNPALDLNGDGIACNGKGEEDPRATTTTPAISTTAATTTTSATPTTESTTGITTSTTPSSTTTTEPTETSTTRSRNQQQYPQDNAGTVNNDTWNDGYYEDDQYDDRPPYQSCGEYYESEMGTGITPDHPRWNPALDTNGDGVACDGYGEGMPEDENDTSNRMLVGDIPSGWVGKVLGRTIFSR